MKTMPLLVGLTVVNLALLAVQVVRVPEAAAAEEPPAVLRGRGLEIVDDRGRVRLQMKVEPANATFPMPDGAKGYPEMVIFRLITADGKPRVKLTTSEHGAGLMLLGDSDTTQAVLHANRAKTSLKLRNDERTEKVLGP